MTDGLLRAIQKALNGPPGSVTHVDIIHTWECDTNLDGSEPLDCNCEPEYKERRVN